VRWREQSHCTSGAQRAVDSKLRPPRNAAFGLFVQRMGSYFLCFTNFYTIQHNGLRLRLSELCKASERGRGDDGGTHAVYERGRPMEGTLWEKRFVRVRPGLIDRDTALFPVANALIFCTEFVPGNPPGGLGGPPSPVEPGAALLGSGPQEPEAIRTPPTVASGARVQRFPLTLRQWGEAPCSQRLLGRRTADTGQESRRHKSPDDHAFPHLPSSCAP
jgi:hypothetical protein